MWWGGCVTLLASAEYKTVKAVQGPLVILDKVKVSLHVYTQSSQMHEKRLWTVEAGGLEENCTQRKLVDFG